MKTEICIFIYSDVIWTLWRLISPTIALFVQSFVQAYIKAHIKASWGNPLMTGRCGVLQTVSAPCGLFQWLHALFSHIPLFSSFFRIAKTLLSEYHIHVWEVPPKPKLRLSISKNNIDYAKRWCFCFHLECISTTCHDLMLPNYIHCKCNYIPKNKSTHQ